MYKYLIIIALFISSVAAQQISGIEKALDLFMQGKTYELQDNYIKALELYKKALKEEDAAGIYFAISTLHHKTSKYNESLKYALLALKKEPANISYKEFTADLMILLNQYDKALVLLKEINLADPDDINILYNIGRIYEVEKKPSEAIKYYEKITEDYLYDETVLIRMVTIYENYHDYRNAAAAMEKMLYLDPANIELKYRIAATYSIVPDLDNALRIYENILQTNPKDANAQREVIKIYFHSNRTDEAFEKYGRLINKDTVDFSTKMSVAYAFYEAAVDDKSMVSTARSILETVRNAYPAQWLPEFYLMMLEAQAANKVPDDSQLNNILAKADTSSDAYVQVGFVYLNDNKFQKALTVLEPGVSKFPDNFLLNYLTGLSYYRLAKNTEAIPWLEKALYISPKDLNVLSTLGIVYDNMKMDSDAERVYEQAIQYYPDNILLLNNYAYYLSEREKRLDDALEMSKRTIDKEPDNSSYLDTYGWILYKMKDYDNAVVYIEKAVRLGSNAELLEHLGYVYEALGEMAKAVKFWKQSYEMQPDNPDLKQKLDRINQS